MSSEEMKMLPMPIYSSLVGNWTRRNWIMGFFARVPRPEKSDRNNSGHDGYNKENESGNTNT